MRRAIVTLRDVPLVRQRLSVTDGFETEEDALAWGNRACGAACLRMALLYYRAESVPSVKELMEEGLRRRFLHESIGWIHSGIARLAQERGLYAVSKSLRHEPLAIARNLEEERLVIASVSLGFHPNKRGGHLVLIRGVEVEDNRISKVLFRDPSAWGQAHSKIEAKSFFRSWTGNVIVVGHGASRATSSD